MGRDVLTGRAAPYGRVPYRDPELAGNFRLCAVDQKRSFFPRVGPFLGLLPFKGPFPLTGALTGRPPYGPVRRLLMGRDVLTGTAPYGRVLYGDGSLRKEGRRRGLREAPYREGRSLREGPVLAGIQNWAGISACVP